MALPRSRDFRGIEQKSVDRNGNLTLAIREHIAFPEILPEKTKQIFSFEITVVTTAKNHERALLYEEVRALSYLFPGNG